MSIVLRKMNPVMCLWLLATAEKVEGKSVSVT